MLELAPEKGADKVASIIIDWNLQSVKTILLTVARF